MKKNIFIPEIRINVQMCKCANVQICKFFGPAGYKNLHFCTSAHLHICTFLKVQPEALYLMDAPHHGKSLSWLFESLNRHRYRYL
jgi:hypothetical protein